MAGNRKTYELAIEIGGKANSSLKTACMTADKNLSKLRESAKKAAKVGAKAMAAMGGGIVAAGMGLYKVGASFDSAYDAIRIGTGATGDALEDLKDSFKKVYSSVPAEMADVGTAIADYNTRLGATGETLETLSAQALQVSDMLGDDLSGVIENSSQAFQQWNIAEKDMPGEMDYIFKASQSTGVGFTELMTDMRTYGAQMQEMGYGFDESAALIGQLGKEGVNVTEVLGAMKKSVTTMAKEGVSATDGMKQYYEAIKNAGTATEATQIASEVFGSRAASTMSAAIRSGAMDVDALTASLQQSGETIDGAADDTCDFAEKWAVFKQQMAVAIEPAAMEIFDYMGGVIDQIAPKIKEAAPAITQAIKKVIDFIVNKAIPAMITIGEWIANHKTLFTVIVTGITTLVVAFKTLKTAMTVVDTVKSLSTVFGKATKSGGALKGVMGLMNVKLLMIAAVIAAAVALGIVLYKNWDKIKAWAISLGETIAQVWGNIKAWVAGAVANLVATFQTNFPLLSAFISGWWQSISAAIENVKAIFKNIIDFIKNVFTGNWSGAWENIVNIFGNLFGMIVNLAKAPINGVISAINWVLSKINGISVTIPDWVPEVGGKTLGFNIPTIPALAAGGIATAPTLAEIGEGGEPEAVLPLSKLAALLDKRSKKPGPDPCGARESSGGGRGPAPNSGGERPFTYSPSFHFHGAVTKEAAEETGRIGFSEFMRLYNRMEAEERRKRFSPA